jgi:predicted alpha/beta-hydrolase family hydrolase
MMRATAASLAQTDAQVERATGGLARLAAARYKARHAVGVAREVKLATRRRRIALPGGGAVSAVVALPAGFRRPGKTPAVILAHGAGANMTSAFISTIHSGLAREGFVSVKFNFPYTEARRRVPDPRPVLERCYRAVLAAVMRDRALAPPWVVIGGKSLGGRIASHVALEAPVSGLLLLGYPLHPAGRPETLRADHLPAIPAPALFVQGTRDALCDLERLRPVLKQLPRATLHTIEGGDHSFRVPRRLAASDAEVWEGIVAVAARWLRLLSD